MIQIDRKKHTAKLYGGSEQGGITATFSGEPTDKEISEAIYCLHIDTLERAADSALRTAAQKLWAASSLAFHEAHDPARSQKNAGKASTIKNLLPKGAT